MSRLPEVSRASLDPAGQAVWERIAAVRGGVRGPFGVLIHVPALAERVAALEDYFRFDAALPGADRELVVMATAREAGARYAWSRHEARGREEGTRPEAIELVRAHGSLDGLTPRERVLVQLVRSLFRERTLPEPLFAEAAAELGEEQLVETVALIGHYSLVGHILNGFDVPPPDDSPTF
jgi:4-carboxymuconolactone decarboxylase